MHLPAGSLSVLALGLHEPHYPAENLEEPSGTRVLPRLLTYQPQQAARALGYGRVYHEEWPSFLRVSTISLSGYSTFSVPVSGHWAVATSQPW